MSSTPSAIEPTAQVPPARAAADPAAGRWRLTAWVLLGLFTAVHVALALSTPLAPDETYYWEWSRHPGWGYYDQGPMVAWWIRGTCLLFGDTALGIRAGIVAAILATQWLMYVLARDLFGHRVAVLSLALGGITPLAIAGGFIATYDPLVVLFWAAATYFAARATLYGSRWAWLWLGVSFGLGLLSKHTMAVFAPCLLLFLAGAPGLRHWLRRPQPWLALLVGLAVFAPNLWWQAHHQWMTFSHLFHLTGNPTHQSLPSRIGDYVGSQALLITPLLFFGMVWALWWAARRPQRQDQGLWLMLCTSAPVLLVFLLVAAKTKVQGNWAVCGWLAPPVVYAAWLAAPSERVGRSLYAWSASAFCLLASVVLVWPGLLAPLGRNLSPKAHARWMKVWEQPNKLYGGAELAVAVQRERDAMAVAGDGPVVPGAATYDTASRLAFYLPGQPQAYCFFLGTRINSYCLWNDRAGLRPGANALVVDDWDPGNPELPPFDRVFQRVVPVPGKVSVFRKGLFRYSVHDYYLYRCYGYHPDPAVERPHGG